MEGVNLESRRRLWGSRHALPVVKGVYIIWVTDSLGSQHAYVGLSKNIRDRLVSHQKQAEDGTHSNPRLAELLRSNKPEFSIIWSTTKDWDGGGNYEAATAERWACKEIESWWSVQLLNIEPAGNIGGRGYQAVPVFGRHTRRSNRRKFSSIAACAEHLGTTPKKVVDAVMQEVPINGWQLSIKDATWWNRQSHKSENRRHFQGATSVDPNTDDLIKGIIVVLLFLWFVAC